MGLRGVGTRQQQEESLNTLLHEAGHSFDFSRSKAGDSRGARLNNLLTNPSGRKKLGKYDGAFNVALARDKRKNGFTGNGANNLLNSSAISDLSDQEFFAETYAMLFSNSKRAKEWQTLFPEATKVVKDMVFKNKVPNFADPATGLFTILGDPEIYKILDSGHIIAANASGQGFQTNPELYEAAGIPIPKEIADRIPKAPPETKTSKSTPKKKKKRKGKKPKIAKGSAVSTVTSSVVTPSDSGPVVRGTEIPSLAGENPYTIVTDPTTGKERLVHNSVLQKSRQNNFGQAHRGRISSHGEPPRARVNRGKSSIPTLLRKQAGRPDAPLLSKTAARDSSRVSIPARNTGPRPVPNLTRAGGAAIDPVTRQILNTKRAIRQVAIGGSGGGVPPNDPPTPPSSSGGGNRKPLTGKQKARSRAQQKRRGPSFNRLAAQNGGFKGPNPELRQRLGSAALGLSFAGSFLLPQIDEGLNNKLNDNVPEAEALGRKLEQLRKELQETDGAIYPERYEELTKAVKSTESAFNNSAKAAEAMSSKISLWTGLGLAAVSAGEPLISLFGGLGKAFASMPLGALATLGGGTLAGAAAVTTGAVALTGAAIYGGSKIGNNARERVLTGEDNRFTTRLIKEGQAEGDLLKELGGSLLQGLGAPLDLVGETIGRIEKNFDTFDNQLIETTGVIGKFTEFLAKPLTGFSVEELNKFERESFTDDLNKIRPNQERLASYDASGNVTGFRGISQAQGLARRSRISGERLASRAERLNSTRRVFDNLGLDTTRSVTSSRIGQVSQRDRQFQAFDVNSAQNKLSLQESLARFLPEGTADEANRKSKQLLKIEEQKLRQSKIDADTSLNLSTELGEIPNIDFDKAVNNIRKAVEAPEFKEVLFKANADVKKSIRAESNAKVSRGDLTLEQAREFEKRDIERKTTDITALRGIEDNKEFFKAFNKIDLNKNANLRRNLGDNRLDIFSALSSEVKAALKNEKLIEGAAQSQEDRVNVINGLQQFRDFAIADGNLDSNEFDAFEEKVNEAIKKGINIEGIEEWRSANHELFASMVQIQQQRNS